ncbi:hypothetical protein I302_106911 [Kwoniella bestiolae CBS 10118]|uniref:rRNA-processing protein EFG1 n=1 Tax=Kwoniella bestiolae CBS 10118 TaxID=1296100 RepID=A0A1B9G021_9TREE|nr:hypothetical protein I302_05823 [Kwoniella bestiolae CBS 10118]OCF24363.1 hypothetical protein I302_05823 [Kwoniella bestiolae CBS 10118]
MPIDNKKGKSRSSPYKKPKPATTAQDGEAAGPSRPRPSHKIPTTEQRSGDALPGISKLKGQIRQTKRLLAKDTLEPGLRVQTQRRLTSLEADLANAMKRDVEKKNGAKYHMVKFFERQKLLRIIKRLQRKLKEEGKSDKKLNKRQEELDDARVMMNYVLNFPNTEKYISLFPPSSSSSSTSTKPETKEPKLSLPPLLHPAPTSKQLEEELDKSSKRRYEILLEIQQLMRDGKLSANPEEEVKREKIALHSTEDRFKVAVKGGTMEEEEGDDFFEEDEE